MVAVPLTDLTKQRQPNKIKLGESQESVYSTKTCSDKQTRVTYSQSWQALYVVRRCIRGWYWSCVTSMSCRKIVTGCVYGSKKLTDAERKCSLKGNV